MRLFIITGSFLCGCLCLGGCKPLPSKDAPPKQSTEDTAEIERDIAKAQPGSNDPLDRVAARLRQEVKEKNSSGRGGEDNIDNDTDNSDDEPAPGKKTAKVKRPSAPVSSLRCPQGTVVIGAPPPKGSAQYCAKPASFGTGAKQGPYIKWDDSGEKKYEATFSNDLLDGSATTYGPGEQILEYQEFQHGIKSGRWSKWNREGQKIVEGFFRDGKKDGHFKYWDRHGVPSSEGNFNGDIKSGPWIFYDREGTLRAKYTFRDGKKEGKSQTFYANGKVASAGSYRENKPDGVWVYYSEQGQKKAEGEFAEGKKAGRWTDFDEFGRVVTTHDFSEPRTRRAGETEHPPGAGGFVNM